MFTWMQCVLGPPASLQIISFLYLLHPHLCHQWAPGPLLYSDWREGGKQDVSEVFFSRKHKGPWCFISLKKERVCYKPPRRRGLQTDHLMYIPGWWQDYPKVCGAGFDRDLLRLWRETRASIDGWAPSNMQSFCCFRIIQGVNSVRETRPLRNGQGVSERCWTWQFKFLPTC
jgi:hypothetical protein